MLSLAARVVAGPGHGTGLIRRMRGTRHPSTATRLVFVDAGETAWSVQGVDVPATARLSGVAPTSEAFSVGVGGMGRGGDVTVVLDVAAGAEARFGYVNAVATSREGAFAVFDAVAGDVDGAVAASERYGTPSSRRSSLRATASTRGTCRCSRRRRSAAAAVLVGRARRHLLPARLPGQRARADLRHADAALLGGRRRSSGTTACPR